MSAPIPIAERCSCGATFSSQGSNFRSSAGGGTNGQHRGVEEMAERWRAEHRHEFPPMPPVPRAGIRLHQSQRARS